MNRLLTMEIAGVTIGIEGEAGIIIQEPYPLIRPFLRDGGGRNRANISLDLRTDCTGPENLRQFERVFDSGQAWSLWQDGRHKLIRFQVPQMARPMWQVVLAPDLSTGTLFVGDILVTAGKGHSVVTNPLNYPLDQLLVMYYLAQRDGLVVHAAGAVIGGSGYLFAGVSGAGKSTLSRLLAAGGHRVFSDDRIILRKTDQGHALWGTPWPGDAAVAVNASAPLAGLFFLNQDRKSRIVPMGPGEALQRLMPVASVPWYDGQVVSAVLDRCGDLLGAVPAFGLNFQPTPEVVRVLEAFQVSA